MGIGVDASTGRRISGLPELTQRIARVLSTRRRSLPLRRAYGSNLPRLIDAKVTPRFNIEVYAEIAVALADPANEIIDEFILQQVVVGFYDNRIKVDLLGEYLLEGKPVWLEGIQV